MSEIPCLCRCVEYDDNIFKYEIRVNRDHRRVFVTASTAEEKDAYEEYPRTSSRQFEFYAAIVQRENNIGVTSRSFKWANNQHLMRFSAM